MDTDTDKMWLDENAGKKVDGEWWWWRVVET